MVRLARSSALQFAVQALQTVVGFVAILYFARVLGAAPLGQYFLTLAIVNWLLLPTSGLQKAVNKRVSEDRDADGYYTTGTLALGAVVVVVSIPLILLSDHIDAYTGYHAVWFVIALFALKSAATFYIGLLRADKRYDLAAGVEGLLHTSRPTVQAALILAGGGFLALLWGEAVSMVLAAVSGLVGLRLAFSRPTVRHFRRLYHYAKYSWFSAFRIRSYSWMDVLVLGFFVLPGQVGVYEVAWRISAGFILLPTAISKIVFPHISNRAIENDEQGVVTTLQRALYFAGALSIPGVVGAIILGTDVLQLYGPEFMAGSIVLVVLAVGRVFQSYEVLLLQTLDALDLPETTFRISILFVTVNLGLNVLLVWAIGPVGAAIATVTSVFLSSFLAYRHVKQRIDFSLRRKPFVVQLLSAFLMGGVVWMVGQFVPHSTLGTLLLVAVGVAVYGVSLTAGSGEARDGLRRILTRVAPES